MLRAPISQTLSQPFVCWRCRTRSNSRRIHLSGITSRSSGSQSIRYATNISQRRKSVDSRPYSTLKTEVTSPHRPLDASDYSASKEFPLGSIRRYFQEWENENAKTFTFPPAMHELPAPGSVRNNSARMSTSETTATAPPDQGSLDVDSYTSGPLDNRADVGDSQTSLAPGDLVMIPLSNGREEPGIFLYDGLGELGKQGRYFILSGQWIEKSATDVTFHVPGFVEPARLDVITPYLPETEEFTELPSCIRSVSERTIPSTSGGHLMKEMLNFLSAADATYKANSYKLDTAHEHLAHKTSYKRATLHEAADVLLGSNVKKSQDGRYPPSALYAVHRALVNCEFGIRCQLRAGSRFGGQYEIAPRIELLNLSTVVAEIRNFQNGKVPSRESWERPGSQVQANNSFADFVKKSQRLIDRSREFRPYTPYGTISQYGMDTCEAMPPGNASEVEKFSRSDLQYIRFLELWAGSESFPLQSHYHGIGSSILREMERYAFEDTNLDQKTAWTFLQEIGAISPWANRATHILRLEEPRQSSTPSMKPHETYRTDILQPLRKDWADLPVYCIDASSANELDDGISIEATDVADEYWVHIHTADPSSRIHPDSHIAKAAESKWQTVYFAEAIVSMLPNDYIKTHFSLSKGKPSLTFSARLDKTGNVLETKITPGTVQNVVFLTPTVLDELIRGPNSQFSTNVVTVGPEIPRAPKIRQMVELDQLSSAQEADLKLLYMIGEAHTRQRAARGGLQIPYQLQRSLTVFSDGFPLNEHPARGSYEYRGDPTIRLEVEKDRASDKIETIQNLMLLAGYVAARWCHERGIPVPFRVSQNSTGGQDPAEYYQSTVLPSLNARGHPPRQIALTYRTLCGPVTLSSTPTPHKPLGLDKYTRCTSPLRRYEDMLVHWQVEAAILEEHRTGTSLVGNTKEDFLPFTKARIDQILPTISFGEKLLRQSMRLADQTWLCKLVLRAWKSGAVNFPSTFDFIVEVVYEKDRHIRGMLPFFLSRSMIQEDIQVHIEGEINVGDILEVEISNVDVRAGFISVRPLRRLDALRSQSTDIVGARSISFT